MTTRLLHTFPALRKWTGASFDTSLAARRNRIRQMAATGFSAFLLQASAFAQAPSSNKLEDTATNIYQYLYNQAFWPLASVAFVIGLIFFFLIPNGKKVAGLIAVGIVLTALAPFFLSLFKTLTGSSS